MSDHKTEDTRLYSMAYVRACGKDHKAALVLAQLFYWWPKKRANQQGVKKSASDWEIELELSEAEVARINKVLVKLGLVEIYKAPWGHFKSESTFYILTAKAFELQAPPTNQGVVSGEALPGNSGVVVKAPPTNSGITENTTSFTENTKPNPTSVTPSVVTQTACAGSTTALPAESKTTSDKKLLGWAVRWTARTGEALEGFDPKYLKDIGAQMWKQHYDPRVIIDWITERDQHGYKRWSSFLMRAISDKGLGAVHHTSSKYDKPRLDFFLDHADTAWSMWSEAKKDAEEWAAVKKPTSPPQSPAAPPAPVTPSASSAAPIQAVVAATTDDLPWYQPATSEDELRAAIAKGWKGSDPTPKPQPKKNLTAAA